MTNEKEHFQLHQIVCLEHDNTRLYSEVIQVVKKREMCWVRPWLLVVIPNDRGSFYQETLEEIIYDLRQTADVLWPLNLFRPALDTEVIHLLKKLDAPDTQPEHVQKAHKQLNSFIRQLWQAQRNQFPTY